MKVDTSNNLSGANLCQTNVQCPAIQESKSSQSSASLVVRTYGYDIHSTYAHVVLDFGEPVVHRVKEVISMEEFGGGSTERCRSALNLHGMQMSSIPTVYHEVDPLARALSCF